MPAMKIDLPSWLDEAVCSQVLSQSQAWLIYDQCLLSETEEAEMPMQFDPMMERLYLYEATPVNSLPL